MFKILTSKHPLSSVVAASFWRCLVSVPHLMQGSYWSIQVQMLTI